MHGSTLIVHVRFRQSTLVQEQQLHFSVIDAHKVASAVGMGGRINTIIQTCFFALSGVLPKELAIACIKQSIKKTYSKRGEAVVQRNFRAVDEALAHLYEVTLPEYDAAGQLVGMRIVSQVAVVPASSKKHIPVPFCVNCVNGWKNMTTVLSLK
jgi:pyruvate-ferredoxin/flavodoxin oxidoreductase